MSTHGAWSKSTPRRCRTVRGGPWCVRAPDVRWIWTRVTRWGVFRRRFAPSSQTRGCGLTTLSGEWARNIGYNAGPFYSVKQHGGISHGNGQYYQWSRTQSSEFDVNECLGPGCVNQVGTLLYDAPGWFGQDKVRTKFPDTWLWSNHTVGWVDKRRLLENNKQVSVRVMVRICLE